MPDLTQDQIEQLRKNKTEFKEFKKELNKLISGDKKTASRPLTVGTVPRSFSLCGADGSLPLIIVKTTIDKLRREEKRNEEGRMIGKQGHSLKVSEINKVIESLQTPVMILKGSRPDTLLIVTDEKDYKNRNIVVGVDLKVKTAFQDAVEITSMYGIDDYLHLVQTALDEKKIIAVNTEKADQLLRSIEKSYLKENTPICFDNSIAYTTENVKPLTKEILENIMQRGEEKPMNEQNINLSSLDPAAAEIIRQLQAQLQQQSAENAALKNEMAEVKSEVSEIKAENAALRTEVTELKAEVKEQGSRIDALESSAEIVKAFTAAMSETKSFEQTMAEVQSVTRQITGCEKAEFFCFDNNENKFFSSEDGKTRNWQDNTEQLGSVLFSSEISFADESRTKAFIPVAGNDGQQIGVLVAEKSDGFSETDLKDFSIGGDIMNTIDLAIKKEQNHLTAVTDNLTHLKNRDGLAEYQKTTLVPNSESNIPVNIIMCDIDHFKSINDTYGHDAGDIILKNVAKVLSEHTRSGSDCAFRMGGEEMVCVLNCSPADAIAAAERLRKAVEDTVHTVMHNGEPTEVKVTISVGIHEMQRDRRITPENVAEIIDAEFKQSDNAVYAAKETGRNRVVSADKDTMTDYLVSRAAEAIIDANNLSDTVSEVKANVLKNFSVEEINEHLLGVDTPLAGRVCEQISEFMSANVYFAEKSGKETGVQEHEEAAHGSPGEQSPKEKADDISNSAEECTAEFREMQSNTNELKDTIKDAAVKTAEIVQNKNMGGDAI